jgi:hypothetical protein
VWAYHDTVLPDDVFQALLAGGALALAAPLIWTIHGGRSSWKDDDVAENFQSGKDLLEPWSMQYEQAVRNYRRFAW